jgi:hypothetical protein
MKRKISVQLKEAARAIELGDGVFYTALSDPYDDRPDDFLMELFGMELAHESQNVRVVAMCFAAAVAEAEGK